MRLYLSSFGLGNRPQALLDLLDGGTRVAVVANAADDKATRADRVAAYEREHASLTGLGLQPYELDLRDYFDRPDALRERLTEVDLLWVRGGNSFVLRRALARCGAERMLIELLAADTLVYGGYSAGPVVLTPNLHGIELVDDPANVPAEYDPEPIWDGLGVVPFHLAPHFRSPDHPESAAIDHVVEYFIDQHLPFVALRDGESLVFDGERKEIAGDPD